MVNGFDAGPVRWEDVDDFLWHEVGQLRGTGAAPMTEAFVFHDGRLSALAALPTMVLENAERSGEVLRQLVPQLRPDQLLVTSIYVEFRPHGLLLGIRDFRWTPATGWAEQLWLVRDGSHQPVRADVVAPFPFCDQFSGAIRASVEEPFDDGPWTIDNRFLEADELLLIHPDGALAGICEQPMDPLLALLAEDASIGVDLGMLLVRSLPPVLVDELRARAAENGRSVEEEHRMLLTAALLPVTSRQLEGGGAR